MLDSNNYQVVMPDLVLDNGDVLVITVPCVNWPTHKAKQHVEEIKSKFSRIFPNNYCIYLGTTSAGTIQFTRIRQQLTNAQKNDILNMLHTGEI